MSDIKHSEMTRRDLLKRVAGAAVAGAAGLAASQGLAQDLHSREEVEVIYSKATPVDDPESQYPLQLLP